MSDKLLRDRLQRLESVPNRFINAVNASQPELYAELMEILTQLGVRGGNLVLSEQNLLLVDDLMQQYYVRLRDGRYGSRVSWFLNEMQEQKGLIDAYFAAEFSAQVAPTTTALYRTSTQQAFRSLLGDDFKTNFINVIRDQIVSGIESQAGFAQFRDSLLQLFTNEQRDGQILNWVKQVASDRFATADRTYTWAVTIDLGLQFVEYVGGLIDDSREFCIERNGKVFHIMEVLDWADIEQWQGRYRNTSRDNIQQWLGGYRCQHSVVPRSEARVPAEVIEKAKALGYYKAS